jgi:hypothetical protein
MNLMDWATDFRVASKDQALANWRQTLKLKPMADLSNQLVAYIK